MRTLLIWIAAAYVFGTFYFMVEQKEAMRRNGQTIYLALAPRDPRSPLQGDYMALNYEICNKLTNELLDSGKSNQPTPSSGEIVVRLNNQNVGEFVRVHHGETLSPGEHLLKFHHHNWSSSIGAETYFIQEGSGSDFAQAAYGELKVTPDGTPLLVALCAKDLKPLSAYP